MVFYWIEHFFEWLLFTDLAICVSKFLASLPKFMGETRQQATTSKNDFLKSLTLDCVEESNLRSTIARGTSAQLLQKQFRSSPNWWSIFPLESSFKANSLMFFLVLVSHSAIIEVLKIIFFYFLSVTQRRHADYLITDSGTSLSLLFSNAQSHRCDRVRLVIEVNGLIWNNDTWLGL